LTKENAKFLPDEQEHSFKQGYKISRKV